MMTREQAVKSLVVIVIMVIAGIIGQGFENRRIIFENRRIILEDWEETLGLPVIEAHIDSPSVVIEVDLYRFLSLINELDVDTIYRGVYYHGTTITDYFVFNSDMTIGYCFPVHPTEYQQIKRMVRK